VLPHACVAPLYCLGVYRRATAAGRQEPAIETDTFCFDGLVVASGTNTWASLPPFRDNDLFQGTIIHSENYKKPDVFRGKRVLIVGAGEVTGGQGGEAPNGAARRTPQR
jgi:hypothetical protein